MILIVIAITVWGSVVIFRNIFYTPVETVDFSRIPDDATRIQRQQFSKLRTIEIPDEIEVLSHHEITKPLFISVPDEMIDRAMEYELRYEIEAETKSALDPLKDEVLRAKLWNLIGMKDGYFVELADKAAGIYYALSEALGAESFKFDLFRTMSSKTIEASLIQAALYPVRQAEAKEAYYGYKADIARANIQNFHNDYKQSVQTELDELRQLQKEAIDMEIMSIRDYLIEKTAQIEAERIQARTESR